MRAITISPENISISDKNASFIVLGSKESAADSFLSLLKNKINKKINDKLPGVWGTLGKEHGEALLWKGELQFSEHGNDKSKGKTLEQIKELYGINEELNKVTSKVTEHFINFDTINFPDFPGTFTAEQIPKARLTLFLNENEGALVFYHHFKGNYKTEKDSEIEYILPGETNNTDRKTYIFPILPSQKILAAGHGIFTLGEELNKSFVIKILTFKQNRLIDKPGDFIRNITSKILKRDEKYRLLKFDAGNNLFSEVDHNKVRLDPQAKTLFLIHGTFSSTQNSFNGLINKEYDDNSSSWLQKIIRSKNYAQVISFDHPTITDDAHANIIKLKELLNGVSFAGNNNMDIITTSRGGLVAKYILTQLEEDILPVRKMINIACANGVGYFTTGRQIARFLSIYKTLSSLSGNVLGVAITGFAQLSVEKFLDMPGCQLMTKENERLTKLLNASVKPHNTAVRIQPIVGDWDDSLVENENLFKRFAERGLDLVIKASLGNEHDWVVGTFEQGIKYDTHSNPPIKVRSMHVSYLNSDKCPDKVHSLIEDFL